MDDDEDEDEYGDDETLELEPRRLRALDLVIAVWAVLACFVEALQVFMEHVTRLLVAHRNYKNGQYDFADAIRADLDSIPTEEQR